MNTVLTSQLAKTFRLTHFTEMRSVWCRWTGSC